MKFEKQGPKPIKSQCPMCGKKVKYGRVKTKVYSNNGKLEVVAINGFEDHNKGGLFSEFCKGSLKMEIQE